MVSGQCWKSIYFKALSRQLLAMNAIYVVMKMITM